MKHYCFTSASIIAAIIFITSILAFAGVKENSKSSGNKTQLKAGDSYDLFINNINLPLTRDGVLADVSIGSQVGGGKYNSTDASKIFLFSGGFYLSGYANGTLWANGVATSSRVADYIHGTYATGSTDARAQLYVVKSSDADFSQSWQDWKDAVALGAEFYDGDGDGIYNPVDKNGNGKWDVNEDKPPLIGDILVWCVYSDQRPSALRTFTDGSPQGIEIRQSVYEEIASSKPELGNVVFIKYNILNTGTKADVLDSVFFSLFADADIGDSGGNDLAACDTLLNSGYTYHKTGSGDNKWGNTPPCFMIDVLQGPVSYIPGKSFIDNNSNGVYDTGIDTPIDTAFIKNGRLGIQKFPGALNLPMSSFVQYLNGSDPANQLQARNLMMGKTVGGSLINPCTFSYGKVNGGINCANVDPMFMYSGDPIANTGWINTSPTDQRQISNVGPFTLKSGKPVEIVIAYLVGQGTNALNSITVAKTYAGIAQDFYNSNYGYVPTQPPPVDTTQSNPNKMYVNNFKLPVGNNGILADLIPGGDTLAGGKYDGKITLYSGGFYLSGRTNDFVWSNGSLTASRITDYVPGKVGSLVSDPANINYVVNSTDSPFGQSWQNWKAAVAQGAGFYDGNNDGIYSPVDLNGNGKWDQNEDRPDLLGDKTIWCVYNDGLPASQRMFTDVNPQGIEIQQTVFAQKDFTDLNNVIFIRYRLINKGTVADIMDSVYFGCANDADIGDSGVNDLVGCDTLLSSGYTFHQYGYGDTKWGKISPAETVTFLQGPESYIPGVTFNDINGNGIFDLGIDTPIDSAFNFGGPLIGKTIYPGAKNLNISSFIQYYNGIDPANKNQLRNFLTGKDINGNSIAPCTWGQGTVVGYNCANINPAFMYSGDAVMGFGWNNTNPMDQRFILSSGPFKLEKNKPIDIMAAYIVGQGADFLNSISVAKQYAASTIAYYNSNFPNSIITGVRDLPQAINSFNLSQNYPNPFNPSTRIKYSVGTSSIVSIKVYNILGREVAVLLNEQKNAGEYELTFNSAKYNLASGVYFYKLTAGGNTFIKKMMLLK